MQYSPNFYQRIIPAKLALYFIRNLEATTTSFRPDTHTSTACPYLQFMIILSHLNFYKFLMRDWKALLKRLTFLMNLHTSRSPTRERCVVQPDSTCLGCDHTSFSSWCAVTVVVSAQCVLSKHFWAPHRFYADFFFCPLRIFSNVMYYNTSMNHLVQGYRKSSS